MTKDLGNLDKCIEARAFLINPINEYQKMIDEGITLPEVVLEFARLNKIKTALDQKIAILKTTK